MSVTRYDIEDLLSECSERGEEALAYVCKRALGEDPDAFEEVARLISKRRHDRACALELAQLAGCRQLRFNLQTGTRVAIYNAAEAQLDTTAGAWAVVCETHGSILSVGTLGMARRHAAGPVDWCPECAEDLGLTAGLRPICKLCGNRVTAVCMAQRCIGCCHAECDDHRFPDLCPREGLEGESR